MTQESVHAFSRSAHGQARWFALSALALLAVIPSRTEAAPVSQSDVSLALYLSPDGNTWIPLGASSLTSRFGPHECLCPKTLLVQVELSTNGKVALADSTLSANFLLGKNCLAAPSACVSVGQVSFSATQTAASPTFSSILVFQSASGSSTVTCNSLTAGSTTLWAVLAQDGTSLGFAPTLDLPVITKTVSAPTAVTAQPASEGLLVTWTPPADTSLVAGYQVLCLPRPQVAATAGYESCGLASSPAAATLTPTDMTQLCAGAVPSTTTSIRLSGLENGMPYTIAVVAIDPSGGVSALSPQAQATPQATKGFYEKYKDDGGAATGCAFASSAPRRRKGSLWIALAVAALLLPVRPRRLSRRKVALLSAGLLLLLLATSSPAHAQIPQYHSNDDWAAEKPISRDFSPRAWGIELGISLYRPAVDSELGNGAHPFADTFSNSRRLMSEAEVVRYLSHEHGVWGVGLRAGYYKVTAASFLEDGTRSGDEAGLRLIPFALSAIYRANDLPGLRRVPLTPYGKLGLDGVWWTASNTGASASQHGFSPGWHVAAGMMFGLNSLSDGVIRPGSVADPLAIFFEWDYAAINGFGLGHALHVGDSTWFAGIMFDL